MMKRLIAILITAIMINSVIAQTTAVNESFETWPAPEWNVYALGLGGNWLHSLLWGSDLGYNGGNCAKIQISNDMEDTWLVSPQVSVISNDYQLTFYEKSKDLQYYSYQSVYISTGSGNPVDGDFVDISESIQIEDTWVEHILDLSAYDGLDIYIAFVYTGTWTHWVVDEVIISPSSFIDGALTEIINPVGINPVPSTEDIIVTLHNYGTDVIDNTDIEWSINNVNQGTYQVTSLGLNPGEEADITVGQYDFETGDHLISLNLLLADDSNPSNDLIEEIYYVTDPKDAALTKINPEGFSPYGGIKDIEITISNIGEFTIEDIIVEWEVNGYTQSDFQANSLDIGPDSEIILTIGQYDFVEGLNEINATVIVSGDEDLSNNSKVSTLAVNILWESFEGEVFPPEMWNAENYPLKDFFFPSSYGEFYYSAQTEDNYFGIVNDTLYTPLLNIESGDEINFWVSNSAYFTNDDYLIWKDGSSGEVHLIGAIESQLEQWDEVTMDISSAAGINYIGFVNNNSGSYGMSSLDMITSDAEVYIFDNDLGIRDLQFEYLAGIEEEHSFNVDVKNYGTTTVEGSTYTVKLMTDSGILLSEQSGVTLQSWEQTSIEINHTFTEIDVLKVYAYIDYSSDQSDINNTSVTYSVYPTPSDLVINDVGFPETVNLNIPFNTGGNTYSLGSDDISQSLYYQDELNLEGYLYGVTLYYHELFGVGQSLPLQVWVKQTDLEDLTEGWMPLEEMQMVFNDTIQVYPGHNSVYIPFDEPVLITGTNNIALQYYQYDPSWPSTACRFKSTNADGPERSISLLDVYGLDINDLPDYWYSTSNYTYTSFVYQPITETGIISGTVYDENEQPLQGALLTVNGTGVSESTNENGEYILPPLPYSTYDITASFTGYNDISQLITLEEPNETLDFTLSPFPQVSLSGEVYGSDDTDVPLEGVTVSLSGYENLSTVTNAQGEFLFENINGNNEYIIDISLYGYQTYIEPLTLDDIDMDIGTIILDEDLISAYNVFVSTGGSQALVSWLEPISSTRNKLQNDFNDNWYSFTNEPYEEVWLGNHFDNDELITVTSVELLWDIYENAHDYVSIDIIDMEGNTLVSSQPFLTHHDSLMTIDIPNLSIEEGFYAMVHWYDNPISTDPLAIDLTDGIQNTAYIKYAGEPAVLMSDFIGTPPASWILRVNTLEESSNRETREVLSYNIYKGLADAIDEANQWTALNAEPITDLMFVDESWNNNDPLMYTYAVEATYIEGDAEFTFSNFIAGYTSIVENKEDNVTIYPNPVSSTLNISGTEGTTITIYNIIGEIIYSEFTQSPTSQIDVSNLDNGSYFIRISGLNKQIIKKLVVAR